MTPNWKRELLEQEYEAPLTDTVRGYFSDGESLRSLAQILHVKEQSLLEFCRAHGIHFRITLDRRRRESRDPRRVTDGFLAARRCPVIDGHRTTYEGLASRAGITARTIHYRIRRGSSLSMAPKSRSRWRAQPSWTRPWLKPTPSLAMVMRVKMFAGPQVKAAKVGSGFAPTLSLRSAQSLVGVLVQAGITPTSMQSHTNTRESLP